ncbi:MAG: hypothetical protein KAV82_02170, partial [Phycisphaerae bacterium]|nr:hypothetical protein [Phycisphaerae bacterium]
DAENAEKKGVHHILAGCALSRRRCERPHSQFSILHSQFITFPIPPFSIFNFQFPPVPLGGELSGLDAIALWETHRGEIFVDGIALP